jgi:LysM repeat protein
MIKLLFVLAFSFNTDHPQDSIGVETIDGHVFVIHKVDEKETLFAISRRYHTPVDEILKYNASAGSGLEIGQVLKVPYNPPAKRPTGGLVHVVAPKETLYSISRLYQVSVDDLKQWNHLADNALTIGQELVVKRSPTAPVRPPQEEPSANRPMISRNGVHTVQPKETLFSIARQYQVSVDDLKTWNHLGGSELSIGQTIYVSSPEKTGVAARTEESTVKPVTPPVQREKEPQKNVQTPAVNEPVTRNPNPQQKTEPTGQSPESIRISESLKTGDEIVEGGLAELIEGTEGNRKYLALHRTAPMGTILKVRNEMNNREVFVRVMGKLPDTALTNKLIIKISKSAYDRLGAIDPRFRVEVTYYK